MKKSLLTNTGSFIVLAAAAQVSLAAEIPKNEFRFGPHFGFNLKARFQGFPQSALPAPPSAGPNVDREYSDGFVRLDSSGNAEGRTWYWGYENSSQYNSEASTMAYHHSQVTQESSPSRNDDPSPGFELSYLRLLQPGKKVDVWLEAAFAYTRLEVVDTSVHSVNATVTTDTFPLNGVIPPAAGYSGTFSGPGPEMGATPTRQSATSAGTLSGRREVEADIFCFRLGPVFMLPVGERLRVELGAGLAAAAVDSEFSYSETLSTDGISESSSGNGSGVEGTFGPYIRGAINVGLTDRWGLFAGVQYQHLVDVISQSAGGKIVELDFRDSLYVTAGVTFSF